VISALRLLACVGLALAAGPAYAQPTPSDEEAPAAEDELTDEELIEAMEAEMAAEEEEGDVGDVDDLGAYDALGFDDLSSSLEGTDPPPVLPLFGETTFSLVNTTITEVRSNDFVDDQYLGGDAIAWTLIERLELIMQGENLRLSARVDAFVPILEPNRCDTGTETLLCDLEWDLRPERLNLLWTPGDFNVQLGDSHAILGRGIALSMRKVDQLGIDNTVRGSYVQYDGDPMYARLLAGLANPQNLDPVDLTIRGQPRDVFGDPLDAMLGAEAGFRLGPSRDFEFGVHGARVFFEPEIVRHERTVATVYGWHAATPALLDGALALYGEVNALVREDEDPMLLSHREWGRAVYVSSQVSAGNTSLLLQWKDYRNFSVAPFGSPPEYRVYSAQPSLDRDTERFRGIHNSRGGNVELTYRFAPSPWGLTATAIVYGHEDEDSDIDPWDGILVTHGLLSLNKQSGEVAEGSVGWALEAIGGYRRETYLRDFPVLLANAGDMDWEVIHGEIDGSIAYGAHGFELRVEQRFERRRLFNVVEYVRGGATLTWSFAGRLHVSPVLLWNTEKALEPDLYPGIEVRWEFVRGSHVRTFVGQRPGGRICAGGLCRDVPPFEGGFLELVLRL
jgi:hypothetical protein